MLFWVENWIIFGKNNNPMDTLPLRLMTFTDNILNLNKLEGQGIYELWKRFKILLQQCPTHEIPDKLLLDCICRGIGRENRIVVDQLFSGWLMRHSYETVTQILYFASKFNKEMMEIDKDHHFDHLFWPAGCLDRKGQGLGGSFSYKRHVHSPSRYPKDEEEKGHINWVCTLHIIHKVEEHERVLEKIRENFMMLNQMMTYHSMLIQPMRSQMDHMLSSLYPEWKYGWPYENEANPTNATWNGSCIVPGR